MGNMFSEAAIARQREQEQIEAAVMGVEAVPASDAGKLRKRGAGATTMTLSISQADKQRVKAYAAKHHVTVSDLLHTWIQENCV